MSIAINASPVSNDGTEMFYLPLGGTHGGGATQAKLVVRLEITNNTAAIIKLTNVILSFPGLPDKSGFELGLVPRRQMEAFPSDPTIEPPPLKPLPPPDPSSPDDPPLPPNCRIFFTGHTWKLDAKGNAIHKDSQTLFFTGTPPPVPATVRVRAFIDNKATPGYDQTFKLTPQPVGQRFRFPFAGGDLKENEYYWTSADHEDGNTGEQMYAHDISSVGWAGSGWSGLRGPSDPPDNPGVSGTARIEGKPVRAMANGTVDFSFHTMLENLQLNSDFSGVQWHEKTFPAGGNLLKIDHGGGVHSMYCHMQPNSIPPELRAKGSPVFMGQMVGRAGFTGSASGPHTHIQLYDDSVFSQFGHRPLPFPFEWTQVIGDEPEAGLDPENKGGIANWYRLQREGIPNTLVKIFPGTTAPGTQRRVQGLMVNSADGQNEIPIYKTFKNLSDFKAQVIDLHLNKGLTLFAASTFPDRDGDTEVRRYEGLFKKVTVGMHFFVLEGIDAFQTECNKWLTTTPYRLSFMHTWREPDKRQMFLGIVRSGMDVEQSLVLRDNWPDFRAEVQQQWDAPQRSVVVRAIAWPEWKGLWKGDRFFGLMQRDANPGGVHHNELANLAEFHKWAATEKEKGFKLVNFTAFKSVDDFDGDVRYWAVTRTGSFSSWFVDEPDVQTFENQLDRLAALKSDPPLSFFLVLP